FQLGVAGGQTAVPLDTDLDAHRARRGRAAGPQHLFATHHHLHWFAGFTRQGERQRLQEYYGLAAETAADLGGGHPQARDVEAEQGGAHRSHHVMPLRAAPDVTRTVRLEVGEAGVRLDIALVGRLGAEHALDDHVRSLETLVEIAMAELMPACDVWWPRCLWLHTLSKDVLVQDRGVGRHCRFDIGNMRKHLIVYLDQFQRPSGDRRTNRRNGGDGMAVVKRLAARHDVLESIA